MRCRFGRIWYWFFFLLYIVFFHLAGHRIKQYRFQLADYFSNSGILYGLSSVPDMLQQDPHRHFYWISCQKPVVDLPIYPKQLGVDLLFSDYQLISPRRLAELKCENSSDPALARVEEVYLCDHCDRDFNSLTHLMVGLLHWCLVHC